MRDHGFNFTKAARTIFGVVMASIVIITAPAEAMAKHRKHVAHRHWTSVRVAQIAPPPAATLGPMRYYGGPKSPMWREVR
jgi:hypothetical protein